MEAVNALLSSHYEWISLQEIRGQVWFGDQLMLCYILTFHEGDEYFSDCVEYMDQMLSELNAQFPWVDKLIAYLNGACAKIPIECCY